MSNNHAYGENETDTLTAIQRSRNKSEIGEWTSYSYDQTKVYEGEISEYGRMIISAGITRAKRATPAYGVVESVGDSVVEGYQTAQLEDSLLSGVSGVAGTDELSETISSKRLSVWEKLKESLSWFGGKIANFFASIIPFGKDIQSVASKGMEMSSTIYSAQYASRIFTQDIDFDRSDVEEMFHIKEDLLVEQAASVLDQNEDNKVDELEILTARNLLDTDKSGEVSQEEIDARGGLSGALKFIKAHHREAIDTEEYDERFARYNLLQTLGNSSRSVIGERFDELDRDGNGEVSRDEYRTALAGLDADHNGIVSKDEASKYQENSNQAFDIMILHQKQGGR